jgi:UDP-N-acetylglucosamine acyltransferase
MTTIHPTAIIDPLAKLAPDVSVGAYSVIGPHVKIGTGTWIGPHVVIHGPTEIGCENKIYQFASIGDIPQDMKFKGEQTYLQIGDRNTIRECCTINRGTAQDQSITKLGDDNLFMAYVHVAHDCFVGNRTIFANNASLAGHVIIEDDVTLGGFSAVFQFCRVGTNSFVAGNTGVIKDVPPYIKVSGYYAKPYGLNVVGLQRRGFAEEVILALRRAYKTLYRNGFSLVDALTTLKANPIPEVQRFAHFVETSKTGIAR